MTGFETDRTIPAAEEAGERWTQAGDTSLAYDVEVLVVEINKYGHPGCVITRVYGGHNYVYDRYNSDLVTAGEEFGWHDLHPRAFRQKLNRAEHGYKGLGESISLDYLPLDDSNLQAGDLARVRHFILWCESDSPDILVGKDIYEAELLESNVVVEAELAKRAELKQQVARQLVKSAMHRERLAISGLPRFTQGDSLRLPIPQADLVDGQFRTIKRCVLGGGQAADYFVDINLRPFRREQGVSRGEVLFTPSGDALLVPYLPPLGHGTEADPLVELGINIGSTTVHNPAIREQQVAVTVDGITYSAEADPELSSRFFEQPGHHMVFNKFKLPGGGPNVVQLSQVQVEALLEPYRRDLALVTGALPPQEVVERNKIIQSINRLSPVGEFPTAAKLLVPLSMVDSIEVTFLATTS